MSTNVSLANICEQRKKQLIFTTASTESRLNIFDKSPYPTYTQSQLDMRRKAEILKYSSNKQSTQTNQLSQKQRFSQIMKNRNNLNSSSINNTPTTCPELNTIIKTPTSSSDVPGPVIDLFLDKNVPLYNYAKNTANYGIAIPFDEDMWKIITTPDNTFHQDKQESELFSLKITESINKPSYIYQLKIPIGIYITGKTKNTNSIQEYKNVELSLDQLTPFTIIVKYNNNIVSITNPVVIYSTNNSNIQSLNLDISNNISTFEAKLYSGVITVNNLNLFTENGYVYDIFIRPNLSINIGDSKITSDFFVEFDISYGILSNISENIKLENTNCIINTNPSNTEHTPFSFIVIS